MDKFKVGQEVMFGGNEAKIWGVAEQEDVYGCKYAIGFINHNGRLINRIVPEESLTKIKTAQCYFFCF